MKGVMHKILFSIILLMCLTACQTIATPTGERNFATEVAKFESQFPNPQIESYQQLLISFGNEKLSDEMENCYSRSKESVTLVLLVSGNGEITQVFSDVENEKAKCFRETFLQVRFPKPPIAEYRHALKFVEAR